MSSSEQIHDKHHDGPFSNLLHYTGVDDMGLVNQDSKM